MARTLNRLSDRRVRTAKAGMHCDGGGLYLRSPLDQTAHSGALGCSDIKRRQPPVSAKWGWAPCRLLA